MGGIFSPSRKAPRAIERAACCGSAPDARTFYTRTKPAGGPERPSSVALSSPSSAAAAAEVGARRPFSFSGSVCELRGSRFAAIAAPSASPD
jgi:hypothetical protein